MITTLEELEALAEEHKKEEEAYSEIISVCTGVSCISLNSEATLEAIKNELKIRGQESCCKVKSVGCKGLCSKGPLVELHKSDLMYAEVKAEDAKDVIDSALNKTKLDRLLIDHKQMPFFAKQYKIVLENAGYVDPLSIEDYIAKDGYKALLTVLTEMSPLEVIDQIKQSGLRGRGGGGYPTGLKWSTVQKAVGDIKYVVCNGDEGDPGAFMDRSVMEADPFRVLEGMTIAAYAVGASKGFLYIRAEYPLAVEHIKKAIKQAEKYGFLGNNICGTKFNLELEVRLGAGAFVCGEETALLNSIMGNRGNPVPRPPFPAEKGLWGKPTLINNVETYANVPTIIKKGGSWYASIGTEGSKGTKVFALTGKIVNTGIIEVPMGITLREIIYEIGGGIIDNKAFKAVQTGGPSGGCIPSEYLDMQVDYESLKSIGSMMGSGGMIVMDEDSNMVDVAKFFMDFCMSESCGKCVPCRVGTVQIYNILDKVTKNEATKKDIELLEELCDVVKNTSLCGLGQSAPNPVLSTLRFFRNEYEAHLKPHVCALKH